MPLTRAPATRNTSIMPSQQPKSVQGPGIMSSLSIFGLGTSETVLLILHLVLVALCIWHLTVRSGYGEARASP